MKEFCFLFILLSQVTLAQNGNERLWSELRLTADDFQMNITVPESQPCFAQFSITYSVHGFDFFTNNFNKKVRNTMMLNASWINKDSPRLNELLQYQQILFDMSEVYSRIFRQELLRNKKQIVKGLAIVKEIDQRVMSHMSEERARFEKETEGGSKPDAVRLWEEDIHARLLTLDLFRYEYDKKIKLEK
jgi:hypothetical protein